MIGHTLVRVMETHGSLHAQVEYIFQPSQLILQFLNCEFVTFSIGPEQLQCKDCNEILCSNSVPKCTKTKGSISFQVLLTFRVVTLDYCSVPAFSTHMYTLHTGSI